MCLWCIVLPSSFQFFKISRSSEEDERHKDGEGRQEARAQGGVEVDEKQYVINGVGILKLSVFCLPLTLSYFMFKLKFMLNFLLIFSWWCGILKSECRYFNLYSILFQLKNNCVNFSVCFNKWMFYWCDIWKFQCWKEKRNEVGGVKEEGGEAEGEVSYSVISDLQVT